MGEHALDGEMGLAGIGRPEHGGHASAAAAWIAVRGGRKRDGHQPSNKAGVPNGAGEQ